MYLSFEVHFSSYNPNEGKSCSISLKLFFICIDTLIYIFSCKSWIKCNNVGLIKCWLISKKFLKINKLPKIISSGVFGKNFLKKEIISLFSSSIIFLLISFSSVIKGFVLVGVIFKKNIAVLLVKASNIIIKSSKETIEAIKGRIVSYNEL